MISVDTHPLLDLVAIEATWPSPMGSLTTPDEWQGLLGDAPPLDAQTKTAVRDLLRHGGFKPNGRNKPCNEYIHKAVESDRFPWINPAVDATNLGVLLGGLPISTVDPDLLVGELRVGVADQGQRYVFNPSGQEIDVSGLLCLHDADGPCANSVKDSQRAKTTPDTVRTLTLIWGSTALPGRSSQVAERMRRLLRAAGATLQDAVEP